MCAQRATVGTDSAFSPDRVDAFQPDLLHTWSIHTETAHLLAVTFGLTVEEVVADARDVATLHPPNEHALLTSIKSRRLLTASITAVYLRSLRAALAAWEADPLGPGPAS